MQELLNLQAATLAARTRTGDKSISTSAKSGFIRVVRVVYNAKGTSTVTPMSSDLSAVKAIEFLNAL